MPRKNTSIGRLLPFVETKVVDENGDGYMEMVEDWGFDAARWRWILRHHHPERWAAAWPAFRATAGLDDSPETTARLDLLAALQCLEMVHRSLARPAATRREWVARLLRVLGWEDDAGT